MARVSTYLNFDRDTEAAFLFYRSVFGGEFIGGLRRYRDIPAQPGQAPLADEDRDLIVHVELPILAGHVLMGTDAPASMGFAVKPGNQIHINLEPDTRGETERLFNALAAGGMIETPLQVMFWGGYFGSLVDRFGVRWLCNCSNPE